MSLNDKLKNLPTDAGVYLMLDKKHQIIYVGKAKNLKNRIKSYFTNHENLPLKTKALVEEIADLNVMLVETEVDALLLERSLIRHHKPPYNILLRDDKEYPLVRCDLNATWPRLEKVRRRLDDGAEYLGPFAQSAQLNLAFNTVLQSFPLVRCSDYEFRNAKRPCNYYHMKKCLGPCSLPVDPQLYQRMIQDALAILKGKKGEVIKSLAVKMRDAAAKQKYELAAQYRDQWQALKGLQSEQHVIFPAIESADVFGLAQASDGLSVHTLQIREHKLLGHEQWQGPFPLEPLEEALGTYLLQYYERRDLPQQIILPFLPSESGVVAKALGLTEKTLQIAKRTEQKKLLQSAEKNAQFHLDGYLRKHLVNGSLVAAAQVLLGLRTPPQRIECIDISHFQGASTVASLVVFIDGKPAKSEYRLYNLDGFASPDDYACVAHVVERRLQRGITDDNLPDVLMIDGGKGQLQAALSAQSACGLQDPLIISLAKSRVLKNARIPKESLAHSSERVFLAGRKDGIALEPGSAAFRLLTQLRDEAHRFAITQHRRRRKAVVHKSALDEVKGIGPVLKKRLLTHFQSLEALQAASLEELLEVKGLSRAVAEELRRGL